MSGTLSSTEAYLAMVAFLEAHYRRTHSEDVGALLGDLSLFPDGSPADPAVKADWSSALSAARSGKVDAQMKLRK